MTDIDLSQLRALIGREVEFRGCSCTVIEVLEDGPALVLRANGGTAVIQSNLHGEPRRRVPETHTVSLAGPAGEALRVALQRLV
jgi:hypothetical protein